ncbi:hypothetical protein JCM5296_005717 [Sporobolomyces johnsonii]
MPLKTLQDDIVQLLATLPVDANPYVAVSEYLKAQLQPGPGVPRRVFIQLYVLAAVFGVSGLFTIVANLLLWRKRKWWLFHLQDSPRIVRPHLSVAWGLFGIVMTILMEVLIARSIQFFQFPRKGPNDFAYWVLLTWFSTFWLIEVVVWGLVCSIILHLSATGSSRPIDLYARLTNCLGIGAPIVYAACLFPVGVLAGRNYQEGMDVYGEIVGLLDAAAATWTPDGHVISPDLAPDSPLFEHLQRHIQEFARFSQAAFIFHAVAWSISVVGLATVAFMALSPLRRDILRARRNFTGPVANHSLRLSQIQVEHVWTTLVLGCMLFAVLCCALATVSVIAAVDPTRLLSRSTSQVILLTALWSTAVTSIAMRFLLFWRALETTPDEADPKGSDGTDWRTSGIAHLKGADCVYPYTTDYSGRRPTFEVELSTTTKGEGCGGEEHPAMGARRSSAGGQLGNVSVTIDVLVQTEGGTEEDQETRGREELEGV